MDAGDPDLDAEDAFQRTLDTPVVDGIVVLIGHDPVYLGDNAHPNYEAWVDQMIREGEVKRLTHTVNVDVPSNRVIEDTKQQLVQIATEIHGYKDAKYSEFPMSRQACNRGYPCAFQPVCHVDKSGGFVPIEKIGLYNRKSDEYATAQAEVTA